MVNSAYRETPQFDLNYTRVEIQLSLRKGMDDAIIEAIRSDFPILTRTMEGGRPLVYLDNAATTQKPRQVIEAMNSYYENTNSNVHRAIHTLAGEATEGYEKARTEIAAYFGAPRDHLIFTSGTTEAINLVAYGWARANLSKGDVIVTTEMEHHADIVPWQILSKERGVEIRYIPLERDTLTLDMDAFEIAVTDANLVCVVHTSNVLGVRNDIEKIIQLSKLNGNGGKGAFVMIDAAQAAPHERINFLEMNCDFLALSSHKMGGPTGIGGLFVRPEIMKTMDPFITGGDMIETVTLDGSTFQEGPQKFEAGTPKIAEAFGWHAAVKWLSSFDMKEVHQHISNLAKETAARMSTIPGIKIYGRQDLESCSGVVSFLHEKIHAEDLAHLLDSGGFAVRTGHHCAQPLMEALGVSSTARISFWLYNTKEEANSFVEHLTSIVERFG